jgi:CRP-like cAMP-binding protein
MFRVHPFSVEATTLPSLMGQMVYGLILETGSNTSTEGGVMSDNRSDELNIIIASGKQAWSPSRHLDDPTVAEPTFSCLSEVDLFADLSPAEMQTMDLMAPARTYLRGELVFSQSQPVTALFILKHRRVRVFRISRLLGEQVARLQERLTDLAHRPLSARVARTLITLSDSGSMTRFGSARAIRITHEQIASLIGATREATSKTMSDFAVQHLIRQARGRVIILDSAGLRASARRTA